VLRLSAAVKYELVEVVIGAFNRSALSMLRIVVNTGVLDSKFIPCIAIILAAMTFLMRRGDRGQLCTASIIFIMSTSDFPLDKHSDLFQFHKL